MVLTIFLHFCVIISPKMTQLTNNVMGDFSCISCIEFLARNENCEKKFLARNRAMYSSNSTNCNPTVHTDILQYFSIFSSLQNLRGGGSYGKNSKQKSSPKFNSCSKTRKWLMMTPGAMFKLESPGDIFRIIFSCL